MRELLPRTAVVVIAATIAGLAMSAYQARQHLVISPVEIGNSLFRAVLTSAFTLLVWARQEGAKLQELRKTARLTLGQLEKLLGPGLSSALSESEEAKWRQEIHGTTLLRDVGALRDAVLRLSSLKLLPEDALEAATTLQNTVQGGCDRDTCKELLAALNGHFDSNQRTRSR
ncbi:hypothetical protein [Archangium lansingense]|uniref:Uncharacterized protein n=1 Tax=Archangium lansingense TaxID=2995310 RepID=A0ABT3ZXG5_9BACT|nr:hypothetical protein [Archangium lansinium]MCY1074088.1 hypothetical protein [Archangium lansinium]